MTDKELLELAAKAAGINVYFDDVGQCCRRIPGDQLSTYLWEPLTDDGDALRLAVLLEIDLEIDGHKVRALTGEFSVREESGSDRCAAIRRAIVRVAAEIGKTVGA